MNSLKSFAFTVVLFVSCMVMLVVAIIICVVGPIFSQLAEIVAWIISPNDDDDT